MKLLWAIFWALKSPRARRRALKMNRIRSMREAGYTNAEIADVHGITIERFHRHDW